MVCRPARGPAVSGERLGDRLAHQDASESGCDKIGAAGKRGSSTLLASLALQWWRLAILERAVTLGFWDIHGTSMDNFTKDDIFGISHDYSKC